MSQGRPGAIGDGRRIGGMKMGFYTEDKAAGRVSLEKGEGDRILVKKDRYNTNTGEKVEGDEPAIVTEKVVQGTIEQLEKRLADAQELLADIQALG